MLIVEGRLVGDAQALDMGFAAGACDLNMSQGPGLFHRMTDFVEHCHHVSAVDSEQNLECLGSHSKLTVERDFDWRSSRTVAVDLYLGYMDGIPYELSHQQLQLWWLKKSLSAYILMKDMEVLFTCGRRSRCSYCRSGRFPLGLLLVLTDSLIIQTRDITARVIS